MKKVKKRKRQGCNNKEMNNATVQKREVNFTNKTKLSKLREILFLNVFAIKAIDKIVIIWDKN